MGCRGFAIANREEGGGRGREGGGRGREVGRRREEGGGRREERGEERGRREPGEGKFVSHSRTECDRGSKTLVFTEANLKTRDYS